MSACNFCSRAWLASRGISVTGKRYGAGGADWALAWGRRSLAHGQTTKSEANEDKFRFHESKSSMSASLSSENGQEAFGFNKIFVGFCLAVPLSFSK
jgi:hypothetical protein